MQSIHPQTREAYQLLHDGALAFARAERHGIRVDVDYCVRKKELLTRKIDRLKGQLEGTKLLNLWNNVYRNKTKIESNHQLSFILYKKMKITPAKMTSSGKQGATDFEALSELDIPEVNKILEIRKLTKVRDTYLDGFLREQIDGTLHPFFNLHTVTTFRSSSSNPNFQNIPKRDEYAMKVCRKALYPQEGHCWLAVDYAGVEVIMACIYTEDPKLTYDAVHGDMHKDMAVELYMLDGLDKSCKGEKVFRQGAKNGFVFPQFYGDYYGNNVPILLKWARISKRKDGTPGLVHLSDKGLIKLDGHGNVKNSDKFLKHVRDVEDDFWNVRYRVYNKWKKSTWESYQKNGYIDMKTGFRCQGVMTRNEALNAPFQGSAFHCLLWSFIRIDQIAYQEEKWDSVPIGQIHDEISLEVNPNELEHVAETVQRVSCVELPNEWKWITVPLEVEADICNVGNSWAEKEGYELPEVVR